mgnify:CR=1 FL=1
MHGMRSALMNACTLTGGPRRRTRAGGSRWCPSTCGAGVRTRRATGRRASGRHTRVVVVVFLRDSHREDGGESARTLHHRAHRRCGAPPGDARVVTRDVADHRAVSCPRDVLGDRPDLALFQRERHHLTSGDVLLHVAVEEPGPWVVRREAEHGLLAGRRELGKK